MPKRKAEKPTVAGKPGLDVQVAVRFPAALLDRIDRYVAAAQATEPGLNRADAIRRLLIRQLASEGW